jgi:hypothetical protein
MMDIVQRPGISRMIRCGQFLLGGVLAVALLGGLAEGYLRRFPPRDFQNYLGDASPLSGPFVGDPDFTVTYRSWEAFCADYTERLREMGPLDRKGEPRPMWAFFGNSFIQAPGMLADCARQRINDRRVFNLARNEVLPVRLAQIKLLLQHGWEPDRIFVELMPLDAAPLGTQPLGSWQVTAQGAIAYRPRWPDGPAGWLVEHSELAQAAWFRSGRQVGDPAFQYLNLHRQVPSHLLDDLTTLFGNLARLTREAHVPVTVILIPTHEQITRAAGYAFQDALTPLLRSHGLDVLDPRDRFREFPDKRALFLPDKHFTSAGNDLLLRDLLHHVESQPLVVSAAQAAREP